jgi:hypothetical protein
MPVGLGDSRNPTHIDSELSGYANANPTTWITAIKLRKCLFINPPQSPFFKGGGFVPPPFEKGGLGGI